MNTIQKKVLVHGCDIISSMTTTVPSIPQRSPYHSAQLDIVKAIAIFLVVMVHFFPGAIDWHLQVLPPGWFENFWSQPSPNVLLFLESYAYLGVNLFIIASGFGLYLSHLKSGKPLNLKEFFIKRVWRLMPAALLSIVVLFLVKGLFLNQWITSGISLNFYPFLGGLNLFSNNWFFPPINGDSWFLGLIIQLYLFFPLLVKMYEKIGEKKFLLILFLTSVAFRGLYYVFWKDTVSSLSYGLSIGRLFEFGFGMVLAKRFIHGKKLSLWWILGIAGAIGYFWPWTFPFADSLAGVGLFALLWIALAKISSPSFITKIGSKVAAQSYLIFLFHHPFIWILEGLGFHDEWSLLGLIVFILFFIFSYYVAKIAQWILDLFGKLGGMLFKMNRTA